MQTRANSCNVLVITRNEHVSGSSPLVGSLFSSGLQVKRRTKMVIPAHIKRSTKSPSAGKDGSLFQLLGPLTPSSMNAGSIVLQRQQILTKPTTLQGDRPYRRRLRGGWR
jgi:hypothetical protein